MQALVIDDSRAMRAIIGKILKKVGYQVAEGGNGREGLDQLRRSGKVDLALVDWNMPEMNGYEFVQAVRASHEYDDMPIVMVTTETEMSQVALALQAGANEYVMKPFTSDALLEKIQLLLQHSRR
jgi:two-component system, chemotaxis family, chemotaxis protein CheY